MTSRLILIGTHHKTGTVWMDELFQNIAKAIGAPYHRLADYQKVDERELRSRAEITILFQDHGRFDKDFIPSEQDRGWHLIRDPRDVLISGANYHAWSSEAWLHKPRERLQGQTYQQAIRELPFSQSVLFEMDSSTGQAIRDMLSFNRHGHTFRDIFYEQLIADQNGVQVALHFERLGLCGRNLEIALEMFLASHANNKSSAELTKHIQNLDRHQWRYLYDAKLLEVFEKRFQGAAMTLGYAPSDPDQLFDDPVRKNAYLARFFANRGKAG